MTEHKIDPEKYRGMSAEQARQAMAEDERRTINENPRTIAALQRMEERERAGEAVEKVLSVPPVALCASPPRGRSGGGGLGREILGLSDRGYARSWMRASENEPSTRLGE